MDNVEYNVDRLFYLIDEYLKGNQSQKKCHEALDYLIECLAKIKEYHNLDLILEFEEKWLGIKARLKKHSEPSKFRMAEIKIESEIKTCKPLIKSK